MCASFMRFTTNPNMGLSLSPFHSYIMFDDLQSVLGGNSENEEAEKIWRESPKQCTCPDRITYADFKILMKGQPETEQATKHIRSRSSGSTSERHLVNAVPEGKRRKRLVDMFKFTQRSSSRDQRDDLERCASLAAVPPRGGDGTEETLVANRVFYPRHRSMRLAVLEASTQIDTKRNERILKDHPGQAALIMKRGVSDVSGIKAQV